MWQRPFDKGGSRLRKVMWFSMGFASACAVGVYLFRDMRLVIFGLLACCVTLIGTVLQRRQPLLRVSVALMLGIALGSFWFYGYDAWQIQPARAADHSKRQITVHVQTASRDTERGSRVDGIIHMDGCRYKVRLYMDGTYRLTPGDTVTTTASLRLTDEGGRGEPTYHRTNGILMLAYQSSAAEIRHVTPRLSDLPGILRGKSLQTIDRFIPGEMAGFAKALLLSDRSDISYSRSSQFSVTGISHIVAVSGLHVTILYLLLYRLAGKRRFLTAILGIPALLLFAAMAGFVPSVTRACIMQIIAMLALAFNREYDPPTALSAAVLMMLIWNPLVIAAVGFQLSVGAVAGIFLFCGRLHRWLDRMMPHAKKKSILWKLRQWTLISSSVTISATIMTLPLCGIYFGTVSLVGLLTNLLVLPVISVIFYGTALVCVLGGFFVKTASVIGFAVSILIRYVFAVTDMLSEFPLAAVYTRSIYIVFWLIFCYIMLVILLCSSQKRPVFALGCCVLALVAALTVSYAQVRMDDYRVTALNIGQGQCILLQCNGKTYMVDCGGDYGKSAGDYAARTLLSQGVFHLDGLILSHYDEDHIGGAEYLIQRVDVGTIYLPDTEGMAEFQNRLAQAAPDAQYYPVSADTELTIGEGKLTLFAPEQTGSSNDRGVAVLFQRGKYDTLITGDLSMKRELQLVMEKQLPDCEVLVVGHHGSKSSTSEELLKRIAPDAAMISVGAHNSYGHPSQEAVSRLLSCGCQIFRTDLMGDIIYRG